MYQQYNEGMIEVICGPMFASKTETLISRITTLKYAKNIIEVFKPSIDDRYSQTSIVSHSGSRVEAHSVVDSKALMEFLMSRMVKLPDVVVIDEVQFFDYEIVNTIEKLANMGVRVIAAGLDQDFKGEPFKVTAELMARAEHVSKLTAVCTICGCAATKSQRLIDGEPASMDDDVIQIGASETYEARCRAHHYLKQGSQF